MLYMLSSLFLTKTTRDQARDLVGLARFSLDLYEASTRPTSGQNFKPRSVFLARKLFSRIIDCLNFGYIRPELFVVGKNVIKLRWLVTVSSTF